MGNFLSVCVCVLHTRRAIKANRGDGNVAFHHTVTNKEGKLFGSFELTMFCVSLCASITGKFVHCAIKNKTCWGFS